MYDIGCVKVRLKFKRLPFLLGGCLLLAANWLISKSLVVEVSK
jgi:hypothetical protein